MKTRALIKWHRHLALSCLLLLLYLAITGLLLNHASDLKLEQRYLHSHALNSWYGMTPTPAIHFQLAADHWLSWQAGQLYADGQPLEGQHPQPPIGAVRVDDLLLVGFSNQGVLFSAAGERVENLWPGTSWQENSTTMSQPIGGYLWLEGQLGRQAIELAQAALSEQPAPDTLQWQVAQPPPQALLQQLPSQPALPISALKLAQDLHNGRLFAPLGPWLLDLAALGLMLLCGSGLWLWWRRR